MNARHKLNRESLEERFSFDLEAGVVRYRKAMRTNPPGSPAGTRRDDGYIRIKIAGSYYFAHRLIYFIATGKEPECVDHIDGNKSNNAIANLRGATNAENMRNVPRNLAGPVLEHGKWTGRVMKNYRSYKITPSADKAVAEKRLRRLRVKLHGAFARM